LVPDRAIPDYIEGADALVQPGRRNAFNDYRFPSKLPMFLASGRPVVVFNSNRDFALKDGENCLLLEDGDSDEIAGKLERLIQDKWLRRQLGRSGRSFAHEHFSWEKSAFQLLQFYRGILGGKTAG
jgi:glycosyltransferase involved in cell wall biosynthesis